MNQDFDLVASTYIAASPELSPQFVAGIVEHFKIAPGFSVLELGCGFGTLSLALAGFGARVEALDASPKMIEACKDADVLSRVKWHLCKAEDFHFRPGTYQLVLAYESFHLFDRPAKLLRAVATALTEEGVLCVGWCDYYWQEPLREIILESFAEFGIQWGDWGYQRCDFLVDLILREIPTLARARKHSIRIATNWSAGRIAFFLSSIGKTAHLAESDRAELRFRLESRITDDRVPENGYSKYGMSYWRRLGRRQHTPC